MHRSVSRRPAARRIMQPSSAKLGRIQVVASKEHLEALMQSDITAAKTAPLFDAQLTSTVFVWFRS